MPTMTTPQEIAAAIEEALDLGGHLLIRFAHAQVRQLKSSEVELLVATLKAPRPEAPALWECPACAFAFMAEHGNADGSYTCPVCTESRYRIALEEIVKGEGAFSRDPLTHATNVIENMMRLAKDALEPQVNE